MNNIEEKLKETILDFYRRKYEVHELTIEIEDTVEQVFSIIKKLYIENKTELKNMIKKYLISTIYVKR
jgi:hypothetical protein